MECCYPEVAGSIPARRIHFLGFWTAAELRFAVVVAFSCRRRSVALLCLSLQKYATRRGLCNAAWRCMLRHARGIPTQS